MSNIVREIKRIGLDFTSLEVAKRHSDLWVEMKEIAFEIHKLLDDSDYDSYMKEKQGEIPQEKEFYSNIYSVDDLLSYIRENY